MSRAKLHQTPTVVGRRIRRLREELGWSQEKVGVAIGIDESSARARISRYELGVHEPPLPTVKLIAEAMGVPLIYLYCEDDQVADLLLRLYRLEPRIRTQRVEQFCKELAD
ncbi:MAG: helix-turn-helix transcriptional regulator [Rhodocyclaceae bacterium]|jgi:transcriptional regulator with XRE-family HTH domain|nr:helix-turn-helix transcriptional regulator [Rhodocyclaceae bacterium]